MVLRHPILTKDSEFIPQTVTMGVQPCAPEKQNPGRPMWTRAPERLSCERATGFYSLRERVFDKLSKKTSIEH